MSDPELRYISFPAKNAKGEETGQVQFAVLLMEEITSADGVPARRAVINPNQGTYFTTADLEEVSRRTNPALWAVVDMMKPKKPNDG